MRRPEVSLSSRWMAVRVTVNMRGVHVRVNVRGECEEVHVRGVYVRDECEG